MIALQATLALLLQARAAEPDVAVRPECWEPIGRQSTLIGRDAGGVEPVGSRDYSEVTVIAPHFFERSGVLWLGDAGHLSWYDPTRDEFVSTWKAPTGADPFAFASSFAFAGPWYVWTGRKVDVRPETGEMTLTRLLLDRRGAGANTVAVTIPGVEPGGRPPQAIGMEGDVGRDGNGRVWILLEYPGRTAMRSAVVEVDLTPDGAQTRASWAFTSIWNAWAILPGADAPEAAAPDAAAPDATVPDAAAPDANVPLLALVDGSGALSVLPLREGARPEARDVGSVSALAVQDGRLLVGSEQGCVRAYTREALLRDPGSAPVVAGDAWCPADDPMGRWLAARSSVEILAPLANGRMLVAQSPEPLFAQAEGEPAPAEDLPSQLGVWWLRFSPPAQPVVTTAQPVVTTAQPVVTTAQPVGRAWGRPLPAAESVLDASRRASAAISQVYEDANGRVWATVRDSDRSVASLRRLDQPFQRLADVLGTSVLQVVPAGAHVAVRVEAPPDAPGDAGRLLYVDEDGAGPPREVLRDVEALAGGADGVLAVVRSEGTARLMRLDAAGGAAAEVASLPDAPPQITDLWVDPDIGRVVVRGPAGAVGYTVSDGRARRIPWSVASTCGSPARWPSIVAATTVICQDAELARWTAGDDPTPLVYTDDGRWVPWRAAAAPDRIRVGDGAGAVDFPVRSSAEAFAPLYLRGGADPSLLIETRTGIELLTVDGPASGAAVWSTEGILGVQPRCRTEVDGTALRTHDLFVDGANTLWVEAWAPGLAGPGDGPARRTHLRGPAVPRPPVATQDWHLLSPGTLSVAGPYDRRVVISTTCADAEPAPLTAALTFTPPWQLAPWRRCAIVSADVAGLWRIERPVWVGSAPGVLAILGGLGLAVAVGAALVLRRARRLQEVVGQIAVEVQNPYVAGPPVHGASFFGRREELATFQEEVRNGSYVVLAGEKRIGKTSLLLELKQRLDAAEGWPLRPVAVYFSMERSDLGATFFRSLWQHLARPLQKVLPDLDWSGEPPTQEDEAFERLWVLLDRLYAEDRPVRVVLLLDEFQLLAGIGAMPAAQNAAQKLRSLTTEGFRTHLCWVAAGLAAQLHLVNETSDLLAVGPRYRIGPLGGADALRLITDPVGHLPIRFDAAAVELLILYSHGHPFLIQSACKALLMQIALRYMEAGRVSATTIDTAAVRVYIDAHPVESLLVQAVPTAPFGISSSPTDLG